MIRAPRRSGMSLIEVLTALAIFLLSMVALSSLISFGSERAGDVRDLSRASMLAQSKLAEVVAGVVPLSSAPSSAFEGDDERFEWALEATADGNIPNLWRVTVTVSIERGPNDRFETTLTQYLVDPAQRGSAGAAAAASSSGPGSSTTTTPATGGK